MWRNCIANVQARDGAVQDVRQGDGHLTVMHPGRREPTDQRDSALSGDDVNLVPYPGLDVALAVLFRAHITPERQILQHFR